MWKKSSHFMDEINVITLHAVILKAANYKSIYNLLYEYQFSAVERL